MNRKTKTPNYLDNLSNKIKSKSKFYVCFRFEFCYFELIEILSLANVLLVNKKKIKML